MSSISSYPYVLNYPSSYCQQILNLEEIPLFSQQYWRKKWNADPRLPEICMNETVIKEIVAQVKKFVNSNDEDHYWHIPVSFTKKDPVDKNTTVSPEKFIQKLHDEHRIKVRKLRAEIADGGYSIVLTSKTLRYKMNVDEMTIYGSTVVKEITYGEPYDYVRTCTVPFPSFEKADMVISLTRHNEVIANEEVQLP